MLGLFQDEHEVLTGSRGTLKKMGQEKRRPKEEKPV